MTPFLSREALRPWERAVVEAVADAAPEAVAARLRAQIAQIRYVYRGPGAVESNFYARRRRPGGWDAASFFPNPAEVRMAVVDVRVGGRTHTASVFAVGGHLFALSVRPPVPRPARAGVDGVEVRQTDFGALMRSDAGASAAEMAPRSYHDAGDVPAPAPWSVLPVDDLWVVSLEGADYVVLAEDAQGRLLLGCRLGEEEAYAVADPANDAVSPLAEASFPAALERAARGAG